VVLPTETLPRGSVRIEGGRITSVVEGDGPAARFEESVDASGLVLLPGIIDFHGDMLERDMEPRPGVYFPVDLALFELDKRLAATGVTTAYAAISFMEGTLVANLRTVDRAQMIVDTIQRARETLMVDLKIHARFEITNPKATPAVLDLIDAGQIHLVSLMDHTPGQGQYRDVEKYAEIIEKWRKVSKQEADQMAEARVRRAQEQGADWDAARRVATAAIQRGLPVASHDDDTAEKVDLLVDIGVHISEFPVTRVAAVRARERGLRIAMGAPNLFLGGSHNGNLSAREALDEGLVDILVADYYPAAMLQCIFTIVRSGMLPLHAAVRLVTLNAARALELNDRGAITPGLSADLVLVEDSPRPRARGTLRCGVPIYWDGFLAERQSRARATVLPGNRS
jgi:alpha-D-ribose 1-methylphosphonate 5-triphosphate diphosphatase